ncbi:hypothetical protein, partial [Xanthomonas fragariae]|uniref:hypothetical protein n=1 Tax=Xanthomonas fragariae TaxID=48664 RepID=UPI001F474EE5
TKVFVRNGAGLKIPVIKTRRQDRCSDSRLAIPHAITRGGSVQPPHTWTSKTRRANARPWLMAI